MTETTPDFSRHSAQCPRTAARVIETTRRAWFAAAAQPTSDIATAAPGHPRFSRSSDSRKPCIRHEFLEYETAVIATPISLGQVCQRRPRY